MIQRGEPNLTNLEEFIQYGILADMITTTDDWEIGNPELEEWVLDHSSSVVDEEKLKATLVFINTRDEGDGRNTPRVKMFKVTINVKEVER